MLLSKFPTFGIYYKAIRRAENAKFDEKHVGQPRGNWREIQTATVTLFQFCFINLSGK
jgi:hypothetical protein